MGREVKETACMYVLDVAPDMPPPSINLSTSPSMNSETGSDLWELWHRKKAWTSESSATFGDESFHSFV